MNALTDLTARAVSFVTAIQTTLLKKSISANDGNCMSIFSISENELVIILENIVKEENDHTTVEGKRALEDNFTRRAAELVWIGLSLPPGNDPPYVPYMINRCYGLLVWLRANESKGISALRNIAGDFPTPYNWRETILNILYEYPDSRLTLANELEYMPMEVVLAVGGHLHSARTQRVLQMWQVDAGYRDIQLNKYELGVIQKFTSDPDRMKDAKKFLLNSDQLALRLKQKEIPFSFEHVLKAELREIMINRDYRQSEYELSVSKSRKPTVPDAGFNDAFLQSKKLKLTALCFSGGGIRSATFNLGVIEALAGANLVSKMDYISTVSGGGYIGSWLAAWIKRDGSMVKVTNRLCRDKSPDPLGEELKPIKWLRMFSNYFTPDSSIMSADSWTLGMTWLRNTLINQLIIFSMLLAVLFLCTSLFEIWRGISGQGITGTFVEYLLWCSLLLPIAFTVGLGMHAYHSERFRRFKNPKYDAGTVSSIIMFTAIIAAFILSNLLTQKWTIDSWTYAQGNFSYFKSFIPLGIMVFISLVLVAGLGKYQRGIATQMQTKSSENAWFYDFIPSFSWLIILFTALISSVIAMLALLGATALLAQITGCAAIFEKSLPDECKFILGLPLVLEVFTITVVARMALLGKYFPDDRREWWGRLGGYIHRISFLWILITGSALIGSELWREATKVSLALLTTAGGWIALVGFTVKAAFSGKTSGDNSNVNKISTALNILGNAGPYLFALGLLVFLPSFIEPLSVRFIYYCKMLGVTKIVQYSALPALIIAAILFFFALLISKQVGVNEFSMHYFYRNRLVRAYLGATRRSTDRQRSANPFTGFDALDDEQLANFTNAKGYYGPYPILNTALNASQDSTLDRQDRKAESFIFSPLFCGFDFSMAKSSADFRKKSYDYAYRNTEDFLGKEGPSIGMAIAVSGAAVNPNQGYHSSPATAFMLTVFNVQMGRWIGNPRKGKWKESDPQYGLASIVSNLMGQSSTKKDFVAVSDGGHFDNMGIYEMVRRRCALIIVCDAEQDDEFTCEGLANAIRRCRVDFGAEINLDLSDIITRNELKESKAHYKFGKIFYAGDREPGSIVYIKSTISAGMPADVREYAVKNKSFPHQSTSDQFFNEAQFESYRKLGNYIAGKLVKDNRFKNLFSKLNEG